MALNVDVKHHLDSKRFFSLSPVELFSCWDGRHRKPDINTWSGSKAACSYPAPPAGQGSLTEECQEKAGWKRAEQTLLADRRSCRVQRGSRKQSAVYSHSRGAEEGFIFKYPRNKKKLCLSKRLRDMPVGLETPYRIVCWVPTGPNCVHPHAKQYEIVQHLPGKLTLFIRLGPDREQSFW